jgi:hypothetical protein
MKINNICNLCNEDNDKDNFLCSNCGFYLDMTIDINEAGLPEIK